MAIYDSAWCLSAFNRYTGRPDDGDSIDDAAKYTRLSEGQQAVIRDMLSRVPNSLYPKVPYELFPVANPNAQTDASGNITITGASFLAGATLTLTATVAQFSTASVGRMYVITDPATGIPLQVQVTAYTSTTIVDGISVVDIPASMQAVAITAWALISDYAPDGQVFTFGFNQNGYPLMPMGKARIYPNLSSFPDYPWVEGWDYVNEGTQIRIPNNRTWSGPLFWYGVVQPNDITASAQPCLFPEGARELIVFRTAGMFAEEGEGNTTLADRMETRYNQAFAQWCLAWKTQFSSGGALGSISGLKIGELGGTTNGMYFNGRP